MKGQPLAIGFSDGCQFVFHGRDYEPGWRMGIGTAISVTCPHGKKATVDKKHMPPVSLTMSLDEPKGPKEKPDYTAVLFFADGCEFWMHGDKPQKGWILQVDSFLAVTCPHGQTVKLGQGEAEVK